MRAVFYLTREAARRMTKAGWGRVINIGSVFGDAVPLPGFGVYAGTKFAVQGFTEAGLVNWERPV
jgi:3-oxoacyl-[acyl-carrier protein] reductase